MLAQPANQTPLTELVEWNLKRDVGMTCGGSVKLFFETYNHSDWRIVVFGAGHVASAVVECLAPLDCHVTCIDSRAEWLDRMPSRGRLRKVQCAEPRTLVAELSDDAFVICMTMGHATDRPILEEIFRQNRQFPFLGVIGSKAKRAVLVKELTAAGIPTENADAFHCPIGLDLGTNQPGEIAISVVAQLIQERDRWRSRLRKRRPLTFSASRSRNRRHFELRRDTRAADTGWRSRRRRRRTSACSHRIPASGRAGTSIS